MTLKKNEILPQSDYDQKTEVHANALVQLRLELKNDDSLIEIREL